MAQHDLEKRFTGFERFQQIYYGGGVQAGLLARHLWYVNIAADEWLDASGRAGAFLPVVCALDRKGMRPNKGAPVTA